MTFHLYCLLQFYLVCFKINDKSELLSETDDEGASTDLYDLVLMF